MKRIILIAIAAVLLLPVSAQQLIQNSQYMLNLYDLNPAYAGSVDGLPLAFSFRKLWAGFEGSPSLQNLSAHMEVAEHMGVGAKLFNYTAGPLRRTGFEATYAYHLPLGAGDQKLAFGLSGLIYQYFLDISSLTLEDPSDVAIAEAADKMIVPDISFGTYFYGKNYYAGLAIPQLFGRRVDLKTNKVLELKQVRHYYLHGGYRYEINQDFTVEPSLLLKFIEAGEFQADINVRGTYRNMVSLGLSFRTGDAIAVMLGYSKGPFMVGYCYDITLSDIRTVSSGSHEIMLVYRFNNFLKK
jgi:type IX secretion system PorP/SprF family membrane protein